MRARSNPAQLRAKEDAKVAKNVLARHGVQGAPSVIAGEKTIGHRRYWTLVNTSRLEVWRDAPSSMGRWAIEVKLQYDTEPAGEDAFVRSGSLGLQWEAENAESAISFMRYDVDVSRQLALGEPCHLNVLQPTPFDDRIHLRLPAVQISEWSLGPTLEFLCSSELRDELNARFS